MSDWNRLLKVLDQTIGFPNKINSTVKKRWQGFDQWKNEHVIWLEYRARVNPGIYAPDKGPKSLRDLHGRPKPIVPKKRPGAMATIRELMDVASASTKESSASPPSPKNGKRATTKSALRPKKNQPKSPASPTRPT